jgi:cyclic pyranopterin phosphate synthase
MILKVPLSAKNKMSTAPKMLIDQHGRRVDYIRLSITDRCDFHFYRVQKY